MYGLVDFKVVVRREEGSNSLVEILVFQNRRGDGVEGSRRAAGRRCHWRRRKSVKQSQGHDKKQKVPWTALEASSILFSVPFGVDSPPAPARSAAAVFFPTNRFRGCRTSEVAVAAGAVASGAAKGASLAGAAVVVSLCAMSAPFVVAAELSQCRGWRGRKLLANVFGGAIRGGDGAC